MGHLSTQTLARLLEEGPSPEERGHLESCSLCRAELEAFREQTEGLGALPDLRPPAGDWKALEARLFSEGLIRSGRASWRLSGWRSSSWLQAAAALVLFVGGTALGARLGSPGGPEGAALAGGEGAPELVPASFQPGPYGTLEEAADAVRQTERHYIDALVRYRQILDSGGASYLVGDPVSRFAAIEGLVAAGQAAVRQAPADPFVNGVLVSALAERETLLRTASLTRSHGAF